MSVCVCVSPHAYMCTHMFTNENIWVCTGVACCPSEFQNPPPRLCTVPSPTLEVDLNQKNTLDADLGGTESVENLLGQTSTNMVPTIHEYQLK